MSFSEGGGEPSTQPFQPFLTATRFFFCFGGAGGGVELGARSSISSLSSGVRGRLDEVAEVAEDSDGPGVVGGDEGMSGGVIETDR